MANDVEVKIGANTTSLEEALQNSGKAVRKALEKISEGFAQIKHDFAQGFTLDTRATEEALKRSKQVFNDTRTDLEKYHSKLNELNALHRVGAIDAETHARALKQLEKPPTGLLDKLKQGVDGVKASFDKLNPVIEIFNTGMKIGEKLKQAADGVKDMDTEARKMGNALGISADEAHVLNTALGSVFQDKATYISAASTLSQNIHKNGAAFERLKISTKDAQGNMLPMSTLLSNTTSKLLEYKEGAERNIMSNQLLGKSWDEVENIAKLTPQVMADAAKEVRDYHKELDPEAVKRYSEAMSSASGAFEGIQTAIGKAAMPAFSELGEWLGSIGPGLTEVMIETMKVLSIAFDTVKAAVELCWNNVKTYFGAIGDALNWCFGTEKLSTLEFFTNCIKVVQVAILALKTGIEWLAEKTKSSFESMIIFCKGLADVVASLWNGEGLNGAKAAWEKRTAEIEAVQAASAKRMVAITEKAQEDIDKALQPSDYSPPKKTEVKKKDGGTKTATDLENEKKKNAKQPNAKEQATKKHDQAIDNEISQLKIQLDSFKHNQDERLRIATDIANKIREKQKADPNEHRAALKKIVEIEQQKEQQRLQLADEMAAKRQAERLAEIEAAEAQAKEEVASGRKTNTELLEAQRGFEAQRYEIAKEGLQRRQALLDMQGNDKDMAAQRKLQQDQIALDTQYASKKLALDAKIKQESMQIWKDLQSAATTSATDNFKQVLNKTLSFRDALKNIFTDIGKAFQDMAMKKASTWAAGQGKELAISAAGKAKELALSAASKTKELALTSASKAKELALSAASKTKELALTAASKAKELAFSAAAAAKDLAIQVATSAKKIAVWIFGEEAKTTATETGNATRTASDWLAADDSVAASAWSAIKKVMNYAWEAMAGAYNAMVGIPVVGPALAVGAGALAFGAVAGLAGNIASASGGYDIPAGVNPMTQLHEEEMVLPKPYANVIRGMADGGGASGNNSGSSGAAGGGASHTVNYNDHSGRLTRDQIRANARVIADELSKVTKRGWSPT